MSTENSVKGKLRKIIVINSFLTSKDSIDEYIVEGGTAIIGENAIGKTSLMRLPLLFQGTSNQEVARLAGESNSAGFYLGTLSSYVVFEYQRSGSGEIKLVILSSKDQRSISYRFCDGEFDRSIFTENIGGKFKIIPNGEIRTALAKQGRNPSQNLSPSQYRRVMQSGKLESRNKPDAREINELKMHFSICGREDSIEGLDRIPKAIIESTSDLNAIRNLVLRDVEAERESVTNNMMDRSEDIESTERKIRIVAQAKKFQHNKGNIVELGVLKNTLSESEKMLNTLKSEMACSISEYSKLRTEKEQVLNTEKESLSQLREEFSSEFNAINGDLGQLRAQIDTINADIKILDETYENYNLQNIEEQKRLSQQVDLIESRIKLISDRLNTLREKYHSIISQFDEEINELKNKTQELIEEEQTAVETSISTTRAKMDALSDKKDEEIDLVSDAHDGETTVLEKSLNERLEKKLKLEVTLKVPTSTALTRFEKEQDVNNKTLQAKQNELFAVSNKQRDISNEESRIKQSRTSLLSQYKALKDEQKEIETNHARLVSELERVDQMLYFHVHDRDPKLADLMARTLREDVLKSTIDDTFSMEERSSSVMGLNHDFDQFKPIEPDSREIIEGLISKAEVRLSEIENIVNRNEREIKAIDVKIKSLKEDKAQLDVAEHTIIDDIEKLNSSIKTTESLIKKEKADIKNRTQDEIDKINLAINSILENIDSNKAKKRENVDKIRVKYLELKRNFENEIQKIQLHSKETVQGLKDSLGVSIDKIELDKNTALNKEGAQVELISQAKEELDLEKANFKKAKDAQAIYNQYSAWLANEYSKRDSLINRLEAAEKNRRELENKQSKLSFNYKSSEDKFLEKIEVLNRDIATYKEEESNIEKLSELDMFADITPDLNYRLQDLRTFKEIQLDYRNISKTIKATDKRGKEIYRSVMASLNSYQDLKNECRPLLEKEGLYDLDSMRSWDEMVESLNLFNGGTLETNIVAKEAEFKALGDQLLDLNSNLDKAHKTINKTGAKISKHMSLLAANFNVIQDVTASISSLIDKQHFKKELERAAKIIRQYKGSELDEEYFNAILKAVSSIKEGAKNLDFIKFIQIEIILASKNGERKKVNTDEQFRKISSNGMSFIIILLLFMAIKNSISSNKSVQTIWSLDELNIIHEDNVKIINEMIRKEGISFMAASPTFSPKVASIFNNFYKITESGPKIYKARQTDAELFLKAINKQEGVS